MWRFVVLALLGGVVFATAAGAVNAGAAQAAVTETTSSPYPGVTHIVRTDSAIPSVVHIVTVDLSSQELRLVSTKEQDRGKTTSAWAAKAGVQLAINGDFFDPLTLTPDGLADGASTPWTIATDTATEGFLRFDRATNENHAHIEPPETLVMPSMLDPATEGVVGGRPMLVRSGVAATTFDCGDMAALPCERAPRTAAGLSMDGFTLILVVADGWQADSLGVTDAELARLLAAHGAWDALGFDGGSASTLVIGGAVANSPSDGVERPGADQLGVQFGMLPPGSLIGFIRERDVFNGADLVGAKVKLDTGETTASDSMARYGFPIVAPRLACVTASKAGYHPSTRCVQVPSGIMQFDSIALFPNGDFVDAGPGAPDAVGPPDAAPFADAGALVDGSPAGAVDGGGAPGAPGTCGCRVAGAPLSTGDARGACALAAACAMLWAGRSLGSRRKRDPRAPRI